LKSAVVKGAALASVGLPQYAFAEGETIKVGVLF
jgi:hypothetical protein